MGVLDKIKSKVRGRGPTSSPTPKPSSKPKYEFEIVVLKPGINDHSVHINENMNHEYESYKIKPENLFKVSPGIFDRIRYRIQGIDSKFMVIFQETEDTPISYETPKYSSRVLKTVSTSKALSSALKDEFAKALDPKKFFMYFMLIVGAIIAYLVITGQIILGG